MQIIILIISKENFYFIKNCQYLTTVQDRNTVTNEKLTGLSVTYHPVFSDKTSLHVINSSSHHFLSPTSHSHIRNSAASVLTLILTQPVPSLFLLSTPVQTSLL